MSTSAAIIYGNTANRVNFDGMPDVMLPILQRRTMDEIEDLVEGQEIRGLGETAAEDEFYPERINIRHPGEYGMVNRVRSEYHVSYVYLWTAEGWVVC